MKHRITTKILGINTQSYLGTEATEFLMLSSEISNYAR